MDEAHQQPAAVISWEAVVIGVGIGYLPGNAIPQKSLAKQVLADWSGVESQPTNAMAAQLILQPFLLKSTAARIRLFGKTSQPPPIGDKWQNVYSNDLAPKNCFWVIANTPYWITNLCAMLWHSLSPSTRWRTFRLYLPAEKTVDTSQSHRCWRAGPSLWVRAELIYQTPNLLWPIISGIAASVERCRRSHLRRRRIVDDNTVCTRSHLHPDILYKHSSSTSYRLSTGSTYCLIAANDTRYPRFLICCLDWIRVSQAAVHVEDMEYIKARNNYGGLVGWMVGWLDTFYSPERPFVPIIQK